MIIIIIIFFYCTHEFIIIRLFLSPKMREKDRVRDDAFFFISLYLEFNHLNKN